MSQPDELRQQIEETITALQNPALYDEMVLTAECSAAATLIANQSARIERLEAQQAAALELLEWADSHDAPTIWTESLRRALTEDTP